MSTFIWFASVAQVFSLAVGFFSYKNKAVSKSGLWALLLISSLFIWMDHIDLLVILFLMFSSSSLLSKFKSADKKAMEAVVAKTGPRDYKQAMANLGIALLCMLIYHVTGKQAILAAFTGSVAAANADSWASEIGSLSKSPPVLITNFRTVEKGISGGVTLLGSLGGALGSLFIAAPSVFLFSYLPTYQESTVVLFCASFIAGLAGCVLDSYIGAVSQALYRNEKNQAYTEDERQENLLLVKGSRWLNNDAVNAITTVAGAAIGGTLYVLLE